MPIIATFLCVCVSIFCSIRACVHVCVCLCISVLASRVILMSDGLVWADTSLPPLEPIRIIIKITRRSLWPWLPSISIRNPSPSSSGRSETSFSITCLALCLGEQVATATSPSSDISTVDICLFFARLSVCACLSVSRLQSSSFSSARGKWEPDSLIQIPDPYKPGGLYIRPDPGIH